MARLEKEADSRIIQEVKHWGVLMGKEKEGEGAAWGASSLGARVVPAPQQGTQAGGGKGTWG